MTNPWNPEQTPLKSNPLVAPTIEENSRPKLAPLYHVFLHNDDVNDMVHVVDSLRKVFQFSPEQCVTVMMEAHHTGVALCRTEPLEHAELHQEQLQALSLTSTIEPEG